MHSGMPTLCQAMEWMLHCGDEMGINTPFSWQCETGGNGCPKGTHALPVLFTTLPEMQAPLDSCFPSLPLHILFGYFSFGFKPPGEASWVRELGRLSLCPSCRRSSCGLNTTGSPKHHWKWPQAQGYKAGSSP